MKPTKMNKTFLYTALLVLALIIIAGISGCGQATPSDEEQQMNSDISGVDTLDQDIGTLDADLNDSNLAGIENLL